MIIAIDESGTFATNQELLNFFVAVQVRESGNLREVKKEQFHAWETSLPKSLKNSKGEIKSSSLTDKQLYQFAIEVIKAEPYVGITPYAIRPSSNAEEIVAKYVQRNTTSIQEGIKDCLSVGNDSMARTYTDFGNWFKKLNYSQFLKVNMLGRCIYGALINAIGHSVTDGYDHELPNIRYLVDQDFIKGPQRNAFWREILRNQLYFMSKADPISIVEGWRESEHPFITKYFRNDNMNPKELFVDNCSFVPSHTQFEIRIADAVSTILSNYHNRRLSTAAFDQIKHYIFGDGLIHSMVFEDFDLEAWQYDPSKNPWRGDT